jgi:hypothetical protein
MNPTYKPMSFPMKLVLWFVVANAYAGAISLILFPTNTQSTFFWEIAPPINAGMFGVLYLAAGSLVLQAVLRGQWEPARYLTAMVPAFTGMMLLTTLLHLDKFDQGFELYYWLIVYIVAPLAGIIFYLRYERGRANWQVVSEPIAPLTRVAAVTTGACAVLVAVVAYIFPDLVTESWPWTISPLMVRVFISWLSAFAVSLLWFGADRDWSRLQPVATLLVASVVLMQLMLFIHRDDLKSGSVTVWLVGAGIILIGLLGAFMHWRQRRLAVGKRRPAVG